MKVKKIQKLAKSINLFGSQIPTEKKSLLSEEIFDIYIKNIVSALKRGQKPQTMINRLYDLIDKHKKVHNLS
jgi:hypothetical protein|tara:strand:+ start:273 stop:488 length:216 start_codon:yes stop_codon:yes gene_type:complete